jgi:hypothetical protein
MKENNGWLFAFLLIIITGTSSCQAITDIFKAGVWVGVIVVVLVIGLIFWLISRGKK